MMPVFLLVIVGFAVRALSGAAASEHGGCSGAGVNSVVSPRCRQRHFHCTIDRIVLGQVYRNLTEASRLRCAKQCLSDDRCFSVNYWDVERRCEIMSWGPASRFPAALVPSPGAVYCGPEKPEILEMLVPAGENGLPRLTYRTFDTQTSASSDCQTTDQHLCELWEVQAYVDAAGYAGLLPVDTSIWYAVPDSQAVVNENGVSQHGLPMNASVPGICCPGTQLGPLDPIVTPLEYAKGDVAGQARACAELASHLCMLPELKAAFVRGYRQLSGNYVFFAVPLRDAILLDGGCLMHPQPECYEGLVSHTPRPNDRDSVICCPNLY